MLRGQSDVQISGSSAACKFTTPSGSLEEAIVPVAQSLHIRISIRINED